MQTASEFREIGGLQKGRSKMNTKRFSIVPPTVGLVFALLSCFSASSSAAPAWKLYEPVGEVVIPLDDPNVPRAVEEKDGYVYLLAREGILYTYDISDLPLQQSFTTYNTPVYKQTLYSGNGNGLLRHGNYLYVFGGNGLETIDVQNPRLPTPLGLINDLNTYNMVRHENYLIAAGWQRIAVYSIDEPSNPTLLSDLSMGEEQLVWSAAAHGSTLYVCNWTSDWKGHYTDYLSVIDFSNPSSLSVLNTISRDDEAYHLRVIGDQLIECTSDVVRLWDLTTLADPVLLASKQAGGRVCALDGENIVTNGTVLRPDANDLQIVATFKPGDSQHDGFPYGSAANASFVFIAQHSRILILNASMPPLSINHTSGGPGSFFTITGHGFPPNSTATIVANSYTLGDVATDAAGDCLFLLSTEQADEGRYVVTTTVDRSTSIAFVISSGEPVHPQEGSGTIFQVQSGIAYGKYGGNGSPEYPYQIWTPEQMNAIGAEPNDWSRHFKLMADIDLSAFDGKEGRPAFNVIAADMDSAKALFQGSPFTGAFDGNGRTISHLTVSGGESLGLFGRLATGAQVMDLGVVDVNVTGSGDEVGGLAGYSEGDLTGCYSTGVVRGRYNVGGLVGYNEGNMTGCHSAVVVRGRHNVGGLAGWIPQQAVVTDCYSTGAVVGADAVGGLVGSNSGTVTYCYSTGAVISNGQDIGGLVGMGDVNDVVASFWDIQTSGLTTSAGGTGKTTAEMQTAGTFIEAVWDFVGETVNGTQDIWWIIEGKDYPRMSWELVWFPDYMPLDPNEHGIKTFEWVYGKTGEYTSRIGQTETVPYLSGSITGVQITNHAYWGTLLAANDGQTVKFLGTDDSFLSTDPNVLVHPAEFSFAALRDGMIIDPGLYYYIKKDLSPPESKEDIMILVDIQNTTVQENFYYKSVIFWWLDTKFSYIPPDFHGKESELNITLPSSFDTNGYSITEIEVYALGRGLVACGDIDAETGSLNDLAVLKQVE
jgi:hypothetical protein